MKRVAIIRPLPKPYQFDGMITADSAGQRFRVYEPRWWQVGRWLVWLWVKLTKGRIGAVGHCSLAVEGGLVVVRFIELPKH